jgi:hypothetical protein
VGSGDGWIGQSVRNGQTEFKEAEQLSSPASQGGESHAPHSAGGISLSSLLPIQGRGMSPPLSDGVGDG